MYVQLQTYTYLRLLSCLLGNGMLSILVEPLQPEVPWEPAQICGLWPMGAIALVAALGLVKPIG